MTAASPDSIVRCASRLLASVASRSPRGAVAPLWSSLAELCRLLRFSAPVVDLANEPPFHHRRLRAAPTSSPGGALESLYVLVGGFVKLSLQSAVLGYTMPLWAALLSWLLFRERLGRRLLLALSLGAAAVALLLVPSFSAYADAPSGMILGLLAGLGWACGTLVLKRGGVAVPASVWCRRTRRRCYRPDRPRHAF